MYKNNNYQDADASLFLHTHQWKQIWGKATSIAENEIIDVEQIDHLIMDKSILTKVWNPEDVPWAVWQQNFCHVGSSACSIHQMENPK